MASFSDLPRETLASIVGYLTTKEKEVIIVTNHRAFVTAVRDEIRHISLVPDGDSKEGMDLDKSLDFVRDYCPNLEHFSLRVPRNLMLQGSSDFDGQWFLGDSVPPLNLHGSNLARAIRSCTKSLSSFRLLLDDGCKTEVFSLLREANGLEILILCQNLQVLECNFLALASVQQVADLLRSCSNLRCVKLDNLGFLNSPLWPEPDAMTKALSRLQHLEQLSLVYHQLRDDDVATILGPNSKTIKSLRLRSDFYKNYMILIGNNSQAAGLTDVSMEWIAQHCPNLQHLDVSGNPAITSAGIKRVLDACPLQELDASSCNVRILEWKELVTEAPASLLLVAFNLSFSSPNSDTRIMEQEITLAVVACKGQVLFCETERRGIIKANEYTMAAQITQKQRETAAKIKDLISLQKRAQARGQPHFYWNRIAVFQEGAFARLGTIL